MLRIGLVGGADSRHARMFAGMLNEPDPESFDKLGWRIPRERVSGARITHVWDADADAAGRLAGAISAEPLSAAADELIGLVDAVILVEDESLIHGRRAAPFLKAGKAVFVDKPLAPNTTEAIALADLARENHAALVSCSPIRFAQEIEELKAKLPELGKIHLVEGYTRGGFLFYGIHLLEGACEIFGDDWELIDVQKVGGVASAVFCGGVAPLRLNVSSDWRYALRLDVHAEKGHVSVDIVGSNYFYSRMLQFVVDQLTRHESDPKLPRMLMMIKQLEKADRLASGA